MGAGLGDLKPIKVDPHAELVTGERNQCALLAVAQESNAARVAEKAAIGDDVAASAAKPSRLTPARAEYRREGVIRDPYRASDLGLSGAHDDPPRSKGKLPI
jgi:hypothetical protein